MKHDHLATSPTATSAAAFVSAALVAPAATPATASHLDELHHGSDTANGMAPLWRTFFEHLGTEGLHDLSARQQRLEQLVRDNGVTYNVYADEHSQQRPWSLDLFPMLVSSQQWADIEAGVLQRTRLLNHMMADIYGPQTLLQRNLLPPALVLGHPGYLRAMRGVRPAGDTWLHIAAFDLAHGPDGHWHVVSQRTQAPSGLGYLLENRIALSQQFPTAFSEMKVQRLGASYKAFMQGLQALSPKGSEARMVLLTPGPYNETYFEHAYLARYLGVNLVEGNDLTVRDQHLFLKTLHGLEPVDVLIKRLDDEWLDPLELRSDSALGVPGLMQAVRAGNVVLANAPGGAPLESSAVLGFLPAICQALLGEALALPSLATWWCGEAASLHNALPQLEQHVIKGTYPRVQHDTLIGSTLSAEEIARLRARIQQRPDDYTTQAYLPLSHQPTWHNSQIVPRPAMLRVFALADGPQSWRVLPGGLVRLAPPGRLIASMQRGGSSADCWVLADGEVDYTTLLQKPSSLQSLAQRPRHITSRAAENLFWLGRYTERAENSVRLAQITLRNLQGENQHSPTLLAWLSACAHWHTLVPADVVCARGSRRVFERTLMAHLAPKPGATSVGYNLRALKFAADNVRERLSHQQRHLIERLDQTFAAHVQNLSTDPDLAPQQALEALGHASELLVAITGMQTDRMVRDDGWRMLSIGRLIERFSTLSNAMALGLRTECVQHDAGFEALLALFDSTITFHAQYQQRRDLMALTDMLVIHPDNPRSLAWVQSSLRSRLNKLPRGGGQEAATMLEQLAWPQQWDHVDLAALLHRCESAADALSDRLSQRYFSHADQINRSLMA